VFLGLDPIRKTSNVCAGEAWVAAAYSPVTGLPPFREPSGLPADSTDFRGAGRVDAGLAGGAASPAYWMRRLRGRSQRVSDIRVALYDRRR